MESWHFVKISLICQFQNCSTPPSGRCWWGSRSSCSPCDKWKTKSTPSPLKRDKRKPLYLRYTQTTQDPWQVSQVVLEDQVWSRYLWMGLPHSIPELARKKVRHHLLPSSPKRLEHLLVPIVDVLDSSSYQGIALYGPILLPQYFFQIGLKLLSGVIPILRKQVGPMPESNSILKCSCPDSTCPDISWFDLFWLDLSLLDLPWLDLSWLNLSWLNMSWLNISWLNQSWLYLSLYTFQTQNTFLTPSRHILDTQ